MREDSLSKLSAGEPMEATWMDSLKEQSINNNICTIMEIDDWRTPIRNFIVHEQLHDNPKRLEVRTIASRFVLIDDHLYRSMGDWPLLKCVTPDDGKYILREIYEGIVDHTLV